MIHPLTRMERKLFLKESGVADSEVNVDHIKLSRHDAKSRCEDKELVLQYSQNQDCHPEHDCGHGRKSSIQLLILVLTGLPVGSDF